MKQWHHSGLEGYCKAAAQMMGLPGNNSGWGNFGRDIFADGRFDDPVKASKAWTLSRFRHLGRSNRPKLFEESWLGRSGVDCELEAVHACVHNMCSSSSDSALYDLYRGASHTFAADFHRIVLPAIEDGFVTERYHPADIERFRQGIDKALGNLNPSYPQTFRTFAIPLVAGIIYGPDHAAAQSGSSTATLRSPHRTDSDLYEPDVDTSVINLTQVFDDELGLIGYSGVFEEDTIVFLGRNTDIDAYTEACSPAILEAATLKHPLVFPISHVHKSTSKEHGAIVRIGDTWYFYDFSSNGSYIRNGGQVTPVHNRIVALSPGDRLCLGLHEPADDETETGNARYRLATTLLVSFKVEETDLT